jgi:hypothetical protein
MGGSRLVFRRWQQLAALGLTGAITYLACIGIDASHLVQIVFLASLGCDGAHEGLVADNLLDILCGRGGEESQVDCEGGRRLIGKWGREELRPGGLAYRRGRVGTVAEEPARESGRQWQQCRPPARPPPP